MMSLQLSPTIFVNKSSNLSSNNVRVFSFCWDLAIYLMQHDFSYFNNISDIKRLSEAFDRQHSRVMCLAAGVGVECTLVQDDQVTLLLLKHVLVDGDNLPFKVHFVTVLVVEVDCLRQMDRVVQDLLCCLGNALLPSCNLVIQVAGYRNT